jgi:hypothetical protein
MGDQFFHVPSNAILLGLTELLNLGTNNFQFLADRFRRLDRVVILDVLNTFGHSLYFRRFNAPIEQFREVFLDHGGEIAQFSLYRLGFAD